jgi:hypothetical protein
MPVLRHRVSHSVQTNERSVTVSASTLCQVPGLSTHTVTALFTQVPRPCATSHHMFQVCVNTGSCLYNTVNYLHAARGRETYVSLLPHTLSPSTRAQRRKKNSRRIGGKTWLIWVLNVQFSIRWGSSAQKKHKIDSKVWVSHLSTRFNSENV